MNWNKHFNSGNPLVRRIRNFSDTEYNDFVEALGWCSIHGDGYGQLEIVCGMKQELVPVVKSGIENILIAGGFNPKPQLTKSWSECFLDVDTSGRVADLVYAPKAPSGSAEANKNYSDWYDNLDLIKYGGKIVRYSSTFPLMGYNKNDLSVIFTKANENPDARAEEMADELEDLLKGGSKTEESLFTTSNILIGAGVLFLLYLITKK